MDKNERLIRKYHRWTIAGIVLTLILLPVKFYLKKKFGED